MNPDRTYPNLGHVVIADRVITSRPDPRRALHIILLLAASVGIVMTGFGLIMPVFARRLNEFGSGVEALGIMTMAFALGALLASPVMGSLADRIGRRPLILLSLASFVGVNIGFLFAPSTEVFIAIRAAEGVLTAGLMPAAMGVAADIVPEHQRAQRVGIVMGSMGAGIIFGPVIGGVLYDSWGFSAPFIGSAILAFAALIFAFSLVPETRTQEVRRRERLRRRRTASTQTVVGETVWSSLPRPIVVFAALLLLDSIIVFEYTFNELEWSTIQFGIVVAASGVAIVVGQLLFGRSSDRLGRKPVILAGTVLFLALPGALAFVTSFPLMILFSFVAGLGLALVMPALSAFYIDVTAERHRSRVLGIKSSAASLGGVLGPLLLAGVARLTDPQGVFLIAGAVLVFAAVLALIVLREPERSTGGAPNLEWEWSSKRALAAQTTLRGIVGRAQTTSQRLD